MPEKKRTSGQNAKKNVLVEEPPSNVDTIPLQSEKKRVSKKADATQEPEDDDTKSRNRKTRGSKIISKTKLQSSQPVPIANVILHLKCSLGDLQEYNNKLNRIVTNPLEYNPEIPPEVATYDMTKPNTFALFEEPAASVDVSWPQKDIPLQNICSSCKKEAVEVEDDVANDPNIKDINQKLKQLKVQLYKNAIQSEKKSACFWCTYDFDNIPCYIPKYEMDGTIFGYGSFCRPECAVAYLMKENIDDSTKFERYHLLNQIYSRVYNCKKNIKPAPNPYYLLDKFYGTLSIQEYRKLLKTEHLLLVIDKPLTRILPELHEDTDDMLLGIYGMNKVNSNTTGVYKVKKQSEKPVGPSKTSIIRTKFGLAG